MRNISVPFQISSELTEQTRKLSFLFSTSILRVEMRSINAHQIDGHSEERQRYSMLSWSEFVNSMSDIFYHCGQISETRFRGAPLMVTAIHTAVLLFRGCNPHSTHIQPSSPNKPDTIVVGVDSAHGEGRFSTIIGALNWRFWFLSTIRCICGITCLEFLNPSRCFNNFNVITQDACIASLKSCNYVSHIFS